MIGMTRLCMKLITKKHMNRGDSLQYKDISEVLDKFDEKTSRKMNGKTRDAILRGIPVLTDIRIGTIRSVDFLLKM